MTIPLSFEIDGTVHRTSLALVQFENEEDRDEMMQWLSPSEQNYFSTLMHPKRKDNYLIGRYCAKKALFSLIGRKDTFSIEKGVFYQPVVEGTNNRGIQISLSHSKNASAAIAFHERFPCGIDLECIEKSRTSILEEQVQHEEKEVIDRTHADETTLYTMLWSAKESLSKALRTGLTTPMSVFEISSFESAKGIARCFYKNFLQYQSIMTHSEMFSLALTLPRQAIVKDRENEKFNLHIFLELLNICSFFKEGPEP